MRLTILDWNVNGFAQRGQADLVDSLDWDVACLQEVTERSWPAFRRCATSGDVAFPYLPPLAGPPPRYATAVLVRGDAVRLADVGVLPDMPSPERAALARVESPAGPLWVGSWAAPPARGAWGPSGKGRQVQRFAAWLRDRPGPTLVGIDRNAPRWERPELADDHWWNRHEPLLYGTDRVHDLRDVYRDHLERHPAERAAALAERPEGPLAVTHERRGVACRYDAVYASPEFEVLDVRHLWDEAREAGSDHAAVIATVDLSPTSG